MKLRVVLGFLSYGPYHLARLEACRNALSDWDVLGWQLSSVQSEYGWMPPSKDFILTVTDEALESVSTFRWWPLVWAHLEKINPDVCLLAGYSHPGMLAALLWCRLRQRGVVLMSDSKEDDAPRKGWCEWGKRLLIKGYDAALVAGDPHQRYLQQLGMPKERIQLRYDVVDNFAYGKIQTPPPIQRPYFLTISRLIPKKNLTTLLNAYKRYVHEIGRQEAYSLVICGNGPLQGFLEDQIDAAQLTERIHLTGFLQMQDLLPYLAHAKALVHVSLQEQWGLVVNEAMAAGLPVLVSRACGCFENLVREGENGYGFDALDETQLAELFWRVHAMPDHDRKAMGEAGKRLVNSTHSPVHFAESVRTCVQMTLEQQSADMAHKS